MKVLQFRFRGDIYQVDGKGRIKTSKTGGFSNDWIFLGGSTHHMKGYPNVRLEQAFDDPDSLRRCYGWDRDHGTLRRWGGRWGGQIPKIENPTIVEI